MGIHNTINEIASHITAVSVVKWGLIPAAITLMLVVGLCYSLGVRVTGTTSAQVCVGRGAGKDRDCKVKQISNLWNVLWISMIGVVASSVVGVSSYKMGLAIYNPKIAAGMVGARVGADVISGLFD